MVYIVASEFEIDDPQGLRSSGCEIIRDGGFAAIRDFFSRFDDEETSDARYLILKADLGVDHLVNPLSISRALIHLVRANHGRVVIPSQEWDCISGNIGFNLGRQKVLLFAR